MWMWWVGAASAAGRVTAGVSEQPDGSATSMPASSSVYFVYQKSSRDWMSGISAKLYSGGGDEIDHSMVRPSHGSLPASAPRRRDTTALTMNISTDTAMMNPPIEMTRLRAVQPRPGSYV